MIIQKWKGGIFNFIIKEISKSIFIKYERLNKDREIREIISKEDEIIWIKK